MIVGKFLTMVATFLLLLLPMMILVYLLNLIPRLRRDPRIASAVAALLVILATIKLAVAEGVSGLMGRCIAGEFLLVVLVWDYRRVVRAEREAYFMRLDAMKEPAMREDA